MRTITLGGKKAAGRAAFVDDADYELVAVHPWHIQMTPYPGLCYALANIRDAGRWRPVKMHVLVTGWALTDHIDGDGLNNQRSNLRPATHSQNMQNRRGAAGHSSRYKGVSLRETGKWRALIRIDGRLVHLGQFDDELPAALAYDAAARAAFGEYARPNFPNGHSADPSNGIAPS